MNGKNNPHKASKPKPLYDNGYPKDVPKQRKLRENNSLDGVQYEVLPSNMIKKDGKAKYYRKQHQLGERKGQQRRHEGKAKADAMHAARANRIDDATRVGKLKDAKRAKRAQFAEARRMRQASKRA